MTRLLMLVEGQTEESFVKRTLTPHLALHGVYLEKPILLWTKHMPSGGGYRGGVGSWRQIRKDLLSLMGDTDAWVSTMLDFYEFPEDVPGFSEMPVEPDAQKKAALLERCIAEALGHGRFFPFLALHEFEAWLFSSPEIVAEHFGYAGLANTMQAAVLEAGGPEQINHGKNTHPKARLAGLVNSCKESKTAFYKPASDGSTLMEKIGIEKVRAACPHFDSWLKKLEALGEGGLLGIE